MLCSYWNNPVSPLLWQHPLHKFVPPPVEVDHMTGRDGPKMHTVVELFQPIQRVFYGYFTASNMPGWKKRRTPLSSAFFSNACLIIDIFWNNFLLLSSMWVNVFKQLIKLIRSEIWYFVDGTELWVWFFCQSACLRSFLNNWKRRFLVEPCHWTTWNGYCEN